MKIRSSLLFIMLILLSSSCEEEVLTVPEPTTGTIGLVPYFDYKCMPDQSPYNYVITSNGEIRINVTGKTPTKFSQKFVLYPNDSNSPLSSVETFNGTNNNETQRLEWNSVSLEYPASDDFILKGEFIEYNYANPSNLTTGSTSTCDEIPDPDIYEINEACYQWRKTIHFESGTILNSTNFQLAMDMPGAINCNY